MSLQDLLAEKRLRAHRATAQELADLLRIADRDLAASAAGSLPLDLRFAVVYGAAVSLATTVLAASGYRTTGLGHHETLFTALPHILGPETRSRARYLNRCRRKRNIIEYVRPGGVSDSDAVKLTEEVHAFRAQVLDWLRANHPELLPQE